MVLPAQIISSTILEKSWTRLVCVSGAKLSPPIRIPASRSEWQPMGLVPTPFPNLLAGKYQISVSKQGFQTAVVRQIEVLSSVTLRQNIQLKIGTEQRIRDRHRRSSSAAIGVADDRQFAHRTPDRRPATEIESISELFNLGPGAQTAWGANNPQTGGATHWGSTISPSTG